MPSREPYRVLIWKDSDPERVAFERELDASRMPLALPHRGSWVACFGSAQSLFVGVRDSSGRAVYGCTADVAGLRTLPGHLVYRVQRFGNNCDRQMLAEVVRALAAHARARGNVLRLQLETFAADADGRAAIDAVAAEMGLTARPAQRYTHTLRLNLAGDPNAVLEALPKTARKNLKLAAKAGLRVETIDDVGLASALAVIEREAFARTGGRPMETDWPELIRYAAAHPKLVRIVGLFGNAAGEPPDLLGFAVGRSHGDHVEYASAGTTRRPGLKVSLGYPIMWDLIAWANSLGAAWFDFGGITAGTAHSQDDALGGISDFKRHFGGVEIEVGGEWSLEIAQLRGAVADALSRMAAILRRIGRPNESAVAGKQPAIQLV